MGDAGRRHGRERPKRHPARGDVAGVGSVEAANLTVTEIDLETVGW
jgi:hypothetical protein